MIDRQLLQRFSNGILLLLLPVLLLAHDKDDIPSDIMLSQLKGAIQSMETQQFIIPIEELDNAEELDNKSPFLSFRTHSQFNQEGFLERTEMIGYHNQEERWAMREIYKPYENDQRELYVISLFGDTIHDEKFLLDAVLRRDYSISTHQWNQNVLTKKINLTTVRDLIGEDEENEYIVITARMDDQLRPQQISQQKGEKEDSHEAFLYLTFAEYQQLDLALLTPEKFIYVMAAAEDIANYTKADFQQLHPQILMSVKEDFDDRGNPQTEREYNSSAVYIKRNNFIYY